LSFVLSMERALFNQGFNTDELRTLGSAVSGTFDCTERFLAQNISICKFCGNSELY
jgi:predicted nucleic-acid-binding Zn-ribbon protein